MDLLSLVVLGAGVWILGGCGGAEPCGSGSEHVDFSLTGIAGELEDACVVSSVDTELLALHCPAAGEDPVIRYDATTPIDLAVSVDDTLHLERRLDAQPFGGGSSSLVLRDADGGLVLAHIQGEPPEPPVESLSAGLVNSSCPTVAADSCENVKRLGLQVEYDGSSTVAFDGERVPLGAMLLRVLLAEQGISTEACGDGSGDSVEFLLTRER